jgi:hypothetical protein
MVAFAAWGGRIAAWRFPNAGAVMTEVRPLWEVEEALGSVSAPSFLDEPHTMILASGAAGDEGAALLRKLHFVRRLLAQVASLRAFVLER